MLNLNREACPGLESVSNIWNVLALNSNFEAKYIYEQANMVSDSLAKVAISSACHQVYDLIPHCISL